MEGGLYDLGRDDRRRGDDLAAPIDQPRPEPIVTGFRVVRAWPGWRWAGRVAPSSVVCPWVRRGRLRSEWNPRSVS